MAASAFAPSFDYTLTYSEDELNQIPQIQNEFDTKRKIASSRNFAFLFTAPDINALSQLVQSLVQSIKDRIIQYKTVMGLPIVVEKLWSSYFPPFGADKTSDMYRALITSIFYGNMDIPPNCELDNLLNTFGENLFGLLRELYNSNPGVLTGLKISYPENWFVFLVDEIRSKLLERRGNVTIGDMFGGGSRRKSIRNKRRRSRSQRF